MAGVGRPDALARAGPLPVICEPTGGRGARERPAASARREESRAPEGPSSVLEAFPEIERVVSEGSSSLPTFLRAWRAREAEGGHFRGKSRPDGSGTEPNTHSRTAPPGGGKPRGLFPCGVPQLETRPGPTGGSVRELTVLMVGAASWVACGSSPQVPRHLEEPTSPAHLSMLRLSEDAVARHVGEAVERKHAVSTGRSGPELRKELERLERACREMGREEYTAQVSGGASVKAVRLDPERLALPPAGTAGRFDVAPLLSPALRRGFEEPSSLMVYGDPPRSHPGRWSPTWARLLERLDEAGMLQLAARSSVPGGPWGEDLTAGVFAVAKDELEDRSILNRSRRNAFEARLDGVTPTFPHGTVFEDIELQEGQELRLSADDLPNYYHTCGITRERALTNSFGPILRPTDVEGLAAWRALPEDEREEARASGEVRSLWGVLPMGDGNAVGFGQEAHVNALRQGGCMRDADLLVFRRPLPLGPVMEGVMVDDHVVLAITERGASRTAALAELDRVLRDGVEAAEKATGDVGVLARSMFAYAAQGLAPKASKRVRFETGLTDAWGATLDGRVGTTRGKTAVLWRAIFVSLGVLRLKRATGGLWRQLLGLWSHVLTFARPGFAFLNRSFAWSFSGERAVQRLPGAVSDELRLLLLFAPTFERDLRSSWSRTIACTDASSCWSASVTAPIDEQTSRALWAHRLRRTGYVRMIDPLEASAVYAEDTGDEWSAGILRRVLGAESRGRKKGEALNPWLEELVAGLPWVEEARFRNRACDHINVSEAKAYGGEVLRASRDPLEHRCRRLYGIDSLVLGGAGPKGRSSSRALNRPLRAAAPTVLMTRMTPGFGHLRSAFNPADDPTRGVRLRAPGPEAVWAESVREGGTAALEAAFPQLAARRRTPAGLWRDEDFQPLPEATDGEARVPGPAQGVARTRRDANRAARAAERAASAPAGVRYRQVGPRATSDREAAVKEFAEFLRPQGLSVRSLMARGPEATGEALADYGAALFRGGATRNDYVSCLTAVVGMRRAWRSMMTEAWDVVTEWEAAEPGGSRVPLPLAGFRAGVAACLLWRWGDFALFLALSWSGTLRPGEALHLRRRHVTLPADLVSERRCVFLRLEKTKTGGGRVRGAARVQSARIDSPELVAWLEAECEGLRESALLVSLSTSQIARRWRQLFTALGFRCGMPDGLTPSSLRAGGATELFLRTESQEAVRLQLRHQAGSRSTERYIQEAAAALSMARVPEASRALVRGLAELSPLLVQEHVRRLRER